MNGDSDARTSNPVGTAMIAELKRLARLNDGVYLGDQLGNAALRMQGLIEEVGRLTRELSVLRLEWGSLADTPDETKRQAETDRLRAALSHVKGRAQIRDSATLLDITRLVDEALSDEPGDLPQPPYTVTKTDDGLFLERGSDETPLPPASNPSLYDVLVEAGSYFRQQQEVHAGYRDGPYWGGLAVAAAREAAKALESPVETSEYGWLVENGESGDKLRYRTMKHGLAVWTADHKEALRFARRQDAETFCRDDEEAWRVAEHGWHSPLKASARRDPNGPSCATLECQGHAVAGEDFCHECLNAENGDSQ